MLVKKSIFVLAAIWEFIRFFLLFIALTTVYIQVILTDGQAIYWLILNGSSQLLLPAGLLLLFVNPDKFHHLLNLIKLGKILSLFSSGLLIAIEPFSIKHDLFKITFLPLQITPVSLLLAIIFFDLIFLFILLSYKRVNGENKNQRPLPIFKETDLTVSSEEN